MPCLPTALDLGIAVSFDVPTNAPCGLGRRWPYRSQPDGDRLARTNWWSQTFGMMRSVVSDSRTAVVDFQCVEFIPTAQRRELCAGVDGGDSET